MPQRDHGRIRTVLTAEAAAQLWTDGWCVLDGLLGRDWAMALRSEIASLAEGGLMREHRFQFAQAQFRKPHIYEVDMHDAALRVRAPDFDALFRENPVAEVLNGHQPQLQLTPGCDASTLKLQYNAGGGGCFPCHYDNAGRPNQRQLTCLVYLNHEWQPGDGGELELLPFLQPTIRIPPKLDRAVLFLSDRVLHRVLPAAVPRYCFTLWIDGTAVNDDASVGLSAAQLALDDASVAALCGSARQRAVSRAVYAEEYEVSLRECMGGAEGAAEMVAAHLAHVAQQRAHPQLAPFVEGLRKRKPPLSSGRVYGESPAPEVGDPCQLGADKQPEENVARQCAACGAAVGGRRQGYYRCSQCETAVYCGTECQAEHWPTHRGECVRASTPA